MGSNCVTVPNFVEIGRAVADINLLRFKMAAVRHLIFSWRACLDYPRRVLGGLYRCATFAWSRLCSFEDMWVSILYQ